MNAVQLDFWKTEEECEIDALRKEVKEISISTDKVRKKLFAENTETKECLRTLIRLFLDIDERMKVIERNICK